MSRGALIADIEKQIALWERDGVDFCDVWWALGFRLPCRFGWPQVSAEMLRIAEQWDQ